MSDTKKPEASSTKCTPVLLLLFVGFIFGFIAGYGTKDMILQTLSKAVKTDIEAAPKLVAPSTTDSEPVAPGDAPETTPKEGEENKEEPKKPETDKPADKPS